ncbi:serine hydrolase domain-containing protein [Biostraticola tofi]|uniref:CubicO group peptidase (Beta-lactamase class C family) n=1 Tax=Biostraticola tofi TaxID=466109 RepID=A0A4R3YLJ2_9GAMM|nr:serine hydrolase domain-containing protein [Biostraticola tofi]TCV93042.1 CubicO group peptidase (beta-lactamase class C family) [Biostraticola tofi]
MSATVSATDWQRASDMAAAYTARWDRPGQPGGAIVLFDSQQIRSIAAGGLGDLARQEPFSADSVVRFASVTKHMFAAMVTGPAAGFIGLDDPLSQHLPILKGVPGQVTVGQALDMTAGLPDARETLSLLGISVYTATSAAANLDFIASLERLNYPAGSEISYSNTGYRLVEEALKAKGIRFSDLLSQHICQPLGLSLTAPETWFDIVPGLVPGYWHDGQRWITASAGLHLSASGSIAGSARHLTRWLQSLLADNGPGAGVLDRLCAPRSMADGRISGYGLGIAQSLPGNRALVGHGGSHAGYKTYFMLDRERKAGVVLVANREDASSFPPALAVMCALRGEPVPEAGHELRPGLYVSEQGNDWLEITANGADWLDSGETALYTDPASGDAISLSAHLPMRLHQAGDKIDGEIGHAHRRFVPAAGCNDIADIVGDWLQPEYRSLLTIKKDMLIMGCGPAQITAPLSSLGGHRWLATAQDGLWKKRFSLALADGQLQLSVNRSRVVAYRRMLA